MAIATNLAALARRVLSNGTLPTSAVASLSTSLSATGTDMIVNGLEADTVYRGALLTVAALDGAISWQSRFVSGGAWDTGGSDYSFQHITGSSTTASAASGSASAGSIGTQDAGTAAIAPLVDFLLYTGSASRRARILSTAGYITTDGANLVAATFLSQRVTNGAIADIRFLNVTNTSGLAAGSRVILQRLI